MVRNSWRGETAMIWLGLNSVTNDIGLFILGPYTDSALDVSKDPLWGAFIYHPKF